MSDKKKYFDFPGFEAGVPDKVTKEGTKLYRFRNLVSRKKGDRMQRGNSFSAGRMGGYVEHPELLDPSKDIYIGAQTYIYGNTVIDADDCEFFNATIIDSTIKGNLVRVGHYTADSYASDGYVKQASKKPVVLIKNSEINANEIHIDYECKIFNSKLTGKDVCIEDRALISDSSVMGETYVGGEARIIQSVLRDVQIAGTAFVYESEIRSSSIYSDMAYKKRKIRGANVRLYDGSETDDK